MGDRVKLKLGDTNAYMYRNFKVQSARFPKSWWECLCCMSCAHTDASHERVVGASVLEQVPRHAAPLFVDGPEVDESWAVVLSEAKLSSMARESQTSIHVFSRQYHTPLFRARFKTSGHRSASSEEWDLVRDDAVQEVLRVCMVNGQPADGVILLPDNRRYMLRSVPVWDDRDVLVGVLWSARPAVVLSNKEPRANAISTLDRRRAAVYYDASTRLFVLNETWLRHRSLVGDAMTAGEGNAVLMTDATGHVDAIRNLETAGNIVQTDKSIHTPCDISDVMIPEVAAQIHDAIRQLRDDTHDTRSGQITSGVTGGALGNKGYTITITKVVSGLDERLTGFVISIVEVESLGHLISAMRPSQQVNPKSIP